MGIDECEVGVEFAGTNGDGFSCSERFRRGNWSMWLKWRVEAEGGVNTYLPTYDLPTYLLVSLLFISCTNHSINQSIHPFHSIPFISIPT